MAEGTARRGSTVRSTVLEVAEFLYEGEHPIRVVLIDSEPWFVAEDVCAVAGWNLMAAVFSVTSEDRLRLPRAHLRSGANALRVITKDAIWFISEVGFYEVTLGGRCGAAGRALNRWAAHEVLPTIRHSDLHSACRTNLPMVRSEVEATNKRRPPNGRRRHALYRLYNAAGDLLYVGISLTAAERMGGHRSVQRWWGQVASVQLEPHRTRDAAHAAEIEAIKTEHPRYNIHHQAAS